MAMILADSCILIDYLREDQNITKKINVIGTNNIVLNSIIVMELICGARNKVELNSIKKRLNHFQVLEINQAIMDDANSLMEIFCLSHGLKIPDAIIAATARFYEISLFTSNMKHFKFIDKINFFK